MVSIFLGAVVGIGAGLAHHPDVLLIADTIVEIFMRLLKLVSSPLILIAVLFAITGTGNVGNARKLGGTLLKYTLLTTIVSATIALVVFLLLNPVKYMLLPNDVTGAIGAVAPVNYAKHLLDLIPKNILDPFLGGNPITIIFMAFFGGIAVLILPGEQCKQVHEALGILFRIIMNITSMILKLLPLVIFSFFARFVADVKGGYPLGGLALFLICVVLANCIQGFIVLPLLLLYKKLPVRFIFNAVRPALMMAFITKSSSAALPIVLERAEKNIGIDSKMSRFILPLCLTINMNACAAFILTATLFVSMAHGMVFTAWELMGWILLSTVAAIGNAGVPMGCFMLSSAILSSMNVPLQLMGIILPFYALIDMLESSLNVWSDACVTTIVAKEHHALNLKI